MKTAVIVELIEHYKGRPLHGWHYGECVAGVLHRKGFLSSPYANWDGVAGVLGIDLKEAGELVSGNGAPWPGGPQAGDKVVRVLSNLLDTGKVNWSV